jgi:hypothetical protein
MGGSTGIQTQLVFEQYAVCCKAKNGIIYLE